MASILTFASLKTLKKVHSHSVLLSFFSVSFYFVSVFVCFPFFLGSGLICLRLGSVFSGFDFDLSLLSFAALCWVHLLN